jgi:hypothetical protein
LVGVDLAGDGGGEVGEGRGGVHGGVALVDVGKGADVVVSKGDVNS